MYNVTAKSICVISRGFLVLPNQILNLFLHLYQEINECTKILTFLTTLRFLFIELAKGKLLVIVRTTPFILGITYCVLPVFRLSIGDVHDGSVGKHGFWTMLNDYLRLNFKWVSLVRYGRSKWHRVLLHEIFKRVYYMLKMLLRWIRNWCPKYDH